LKRLALTLTAVIAITIAFATLYRVSLQIGVGTDKIYHFLAFAALCAPVALLYRRALFWLAPTAIAFGGLIELIQPYVNRTGDWLDFAADVAGVFAILIAVALFEITKRIGRNRQ